MKAIKLVISLLLIVCINSFNFGNTTVKLTRLNGATATLMIYTQNNGTTTGSDLTISGLKLSCYPNYYDLTCVTNIQMSLSSTGTELQCSSQQSIPTSLKCELSGSPTITSSNDNFIAQSDQIPGDDPKFGDVTIDLSSVEGNKTIIKLTPTKQGTTSTENLFIQGLTVCNKALTCIAGKILTLEMTSGTTMECTTSEEIEANINCILGGHPIIISQGDSFGSITYKTTSKKSTFGTVKVGIVSAKGTSVTIDLIPEYIGAIKVNISGLEINETRVLECPESYLSLTKEGTQLKCTISQAVNEEDLCMLTSSNLRSTSFTKIQINEDKKTCIARISKYGKVAISLKSVYGKNIGILIQTTFFGTTESNKFIIEGLKLHYDNSDYSMDCSLNNKINFVENGTDFTCKVSSTVNGGKECYLTGVAIFNSEGDTFSDITVSNNHKFSSFGTITLTLESVIGKEVKISLSSEKTGTTLSSITSIDNLKLNEMNLTCPIGVNINFSNRPIFTCTLAEVMNGGFLSQLRGDNPKIIKPDNSNDVFGNIYLSSNQKTSSYGKLEINLYSVIGKDALIGIKSEYIGTKTGITIYSLYVNNKRIICQSTGVELVLRAAEGNSSAYISCYFQDSDYSEQSNATCILTGSPYASERIFTDVVIGPNNVVTSGTRNFGETIIYLYSIKGTTVTIQIKPSLSGKVRPIISNLILEGGSQTYNVICNVADKLQLHSGIKTQIKCYINRTISTSTECRLRNEGVMITSDSEDVFGNIVISTDSVNIKVKPEAADFGNTQIKLTSVIGTQVNINIVVSSTTIYSSANPIIHGLYLGSSELYCVSTQTLYFTNNMAQMSCSSSSPITCTTDCQLSGTPTIVSPEGYPATFGDTTVETSVVPKRSSTLGNISVKLTKVIGKSVYLSVSSTNNGNSYQKVDINNLYVDGQQLKCSEEILFSTSGTQMECTVEEVIPYNKAVSLTGTPNIKLYSEEESADVVEITDNTVDIISKSNTALIIELISVKENVVIISITASDLTSRTLFTNFSINGLTINDIPLDIYLDRVYLSNSAYKLKVNLSEEIPIDVPCSLKGVTTAVILSDNSTFGPISSPDNNIVNSTGFKFGSGKVSIQEVQGYTVKLKIYSSKSGYTKNTELNGLYINDNIPLICIFKNDILFDSYGTSIECKLGSPMNSGITCTLSYKGDTQVEENFETIEIINPMYVISSYKNFGDVNIGLISVSGKNVKIFVKTSLQNITTTNEVKINNLYVNGKEIICEFNDYIEFVHSGNGLNCILNTIENTETYTLTGSDVEIVSVADRFGTITIDVNNNTVRTSPKDIDTITISLSSVAGDAASLRLSISSELSTYLQIFNLRIKNIENTNIYYLSCPKVSLGLTEKNSYSDIIICSVSSKLASDLSLSLVDNHAEVVINSYDQFHEIVIETNSIKSTKFGDIFISYIDSSIAINISSIFKDRTISFINIGNIQLNSSLILDCGSLDSIEIKPAGTIIYCTLRGINTVQGANNKPIFITSNSDADTFSNVFSGQQSYNLKSANCYAFYNKTSCELNSNCVYLKETYGFCSNKINDGYNSSTTSSQSNDCLLYLTEEGCSNNDNCIWNEQDKYSCQTRQIKNCLYLNKWELDRCEECELGFELNNERTKCIKYNDTTVYPCSEYGGSYSCNSKSQCEYSYSSYNYCGDEEDTEEDSNCYLYITREACNSQERCSWKYHEESGCKEKYIDNCLKLKESNPTLCDLCESGYRLSNGICIEFGPGENMCQYYEDDEEKCLNIDYCEYSSRPYCYGEGSCFLFLNQKLCENANSCSWNTGGWEKCQVKNISNCLELSSPDYMTCTQCEDGYRLYDYNTYCLKLEGNYSNCYEYGGEEERCVADKRCEFSDRNFCESDDNNYNYNVECSRYFDKEHCENVSYCYWNTDTMKICKIKIVRNCLELDNNDSSICLKCNDGYTLSEDSTMCIGSSSQFMQISLMAFALILFLF